MENNSQEPKESKISPQETSSEKPLKYKEALLAYSNATLGISMVVAVLIGVGIGYGLERLFGYKWLFWLGVFWGVSAAILNVYKAYKRQKKEFDELKNNPKYAYQKWDDDDDN